MTDNELEKMGFVRLAPWSKDKWSWTMPDDRLKAGVEGAILGLEALRFLRHFFTMEQNKEIKTISAIQNLKVFLDEE